jgi:hypothetical protein
MKRIVILLSILNVMILTSLTAQETIDVGKTGWDVKRPVMAAACESGCPWGELGDFVQASMKPYGYSIILCRMDRVLFPNMIILHRLMK